LTALLSVRDLTTAFDIGGRLVPAVNDVSFDILPGETLGLVGESGSGKSVSALSVLRLVRPPGRIMAGSIMFRGRDLLTLPETEMRRVRGAEISLIFQEPLTALNPVFTVGDQIAEALLVHGKAGRAEARRRAVELLEAVRLPDSARQVHDYPHQLSGGMRQRVLIAIALACQPALLIADEPTTALDVTIQAEILDLLREMKARFNLSLLLITHDLGVVAETADRVAVMYAGRIVEEAPVRAIFRDPKHPYTRGLLASIPGVTGHPSAADHPSAAGHPSAGAAPGAPGAAPGAPTRRTRLRAIEGTVPDLSALPRGCAFGPRCPDHFELCDTEPPPLYDVGPNRRARCYLHRPKDRER
jgi:oligopeptide/dipeptide ABC transporter ATP-binding protein